MNERGLGAMVSSLMLAAAFAPAQSMPAVPSLDAASIKPNATSRPSLFTAIQELGLKVERHPVPVDIVVEHAEKPTEN